MSESGDSHSEHPYMSSNYSLPTRDPLVPLLNLSAVRSRMDSLQRFLSDSVNRRTILAQDQMDMVSAEITSAIQQVIVNGAAILASSQISNLPSRAPHQSVDPELFGKNSESSNVIESEVTEKPKLKVLDEDLEDGDNKTDDYDVVELDAVELLAEHIHFCDVCGKGFKRDANLRMHMRAHGDQFKTPEALVKREAPPDQQQQVDASRRKTTRFSCPFVGCNRNKQHKKFRPLKSVICVKNHFKRSHCPRMYSCNRCNKKNFSVLADLKSHMKHCGESKWRCSCGTSFSRKDKLFGHMALFEGHTPAIAEDERSKDHSVVATIEEDEDRELAKASSSGSTQPLPVSSAGFAGSDDGIFDGFLEGFGSLDDSYLQDMLGGGSPFY